MQRLVLARDGGDVSAGCRAAYVFDEIERALGSNGTVERLSLDELGASRAAALPPGLKKIEPEETLIAFGRTAHVELADYNKRTIFVGDLDLDSSEVDIERLMWSSVNTSRAVGLGVGAWTSMQLLPIDAICVHTVPPLRMGDAGREPSRSSVRVICHGAQSQELAVAMRLAQAGLTLATDAGRWSDEAAIHVHIGAHDLSADEPRIVDSWTSGRLVIQLEGEREHGRPATYSELLVEDQVNGLVCASADEVVALCAELSADPTFWAKLVAAGRKTAAPLLKGWSDIAGAILA